MISIGIPISWPFSLYNGNPYIGKDGVYNETGQRQWLWTWWRSCCKCPDSKVHGADMGPIWGRQDPGGPHVGPMNLAIWVVNSLWPSDAIWHRSIWINTGLGMDPCLITPSHYLNQLWIVTQRCSHQRNFIWRAWELNSEHAFGDFTFKITATSPRAQLS